MAKCIDRFSQNSGLKVRYPQELESAQTNVVATKVSIEQALVRIFQAAGIENIAISRDDALGEVNVSLIGTVTKPTVKIIRSGKAAMQQAPSDGKAQEIMPPAEALRKSLAPPNEDSVIELPAVNGKQGGTISLRQLRSYGEQGALSQPSPSSVMFKDAQGKEITWGQFQEFSKKAGEHPSEDTSVTLPNGKSVTLKQLNEYQKAVDSTSTKGDTSITLPNGQTVTLKQLQQYREQAVSPSQPAKAPAGPGGASGPAK